MANSMDFSLMFFSGGEGHSPRDSYQFLKRIAQFGDQNGFKRIWLPERHFVPFGALHPAPAVLASYLAACTENIRLAAGSVVAPLHPAKRIVEDWSVVDNLSNGRVDLSLASGWLKGDFEYAPDLYDCRHKVLTERCMEVRDVWTKSACPAGDTRSGLGKRIFPSPLQPSVPIWITAARNLKTFEEAGRLGANILTYLVDLGTERLEEAIACYKEARTKANHDPEGGKITLMLHSLLANEGQDNSELAKHYYARYLHNNHALLAQSGRAGNLLTEDVLRELVDVQFERVYENLSLMGSHQAAHKLLSTVQKIGVTEVACLVDFVDNEGLVFEATQQLAILKDNFRRNNIGK